MALSLTPKKNQRRSRSRRKNFWHSWQQNWHYFYWRFIYTKASTEAIARGLAAGVFAGMFPLVGIQIAIAVLVAALIRGNKIIAATATWISNPFTYFPIYAFNLQVGRWFLGSSQPPLSLKQIDSWQEFTDVGFDLLADLFVGCFIVGCISAIGSYFLGLWLFPRLRKNMRSPKLDRMARRYTRKR